ncbi:hypothetical protein D3C84_1155050 [compost metagenome]
MLSRSAGTARLRHCRALLAPSAEAAETDSLSTSQSAEKYNRAAAAMLNPSTKQLAVPMTRATFSADCA